MKKYTYLIGLILSLVKPVYGQTIPRPSIPAPAGLAVNSYTGNLFLQRNEQSLRGTYRIYQSFYYNTAQDTLNYGYGNGWSFYYNVFYREMGDKVIIQRADAKKDTFLLRAGTYQSPVGVYDILTKSGSQFILTSKRGEQHIFADATHKKVTRMQDANGNFATIDYAGGNPVKITNSSGHSLLLTWENGLVREAKDAANPDKKFSYIYSAAKDLIAVTDPLLGRKSFSYSNHHLIRIGDENNNPVVIYYAGNGGRVKQITSCHSEQRFSFLSGSHKTYVTQKSESGNIVTGYSFDTALRLSGITDSDGNTTDYTYDSNNNLLTKKDFNGQTTTYAYDSRGNRIKVTNPLRNTTEYTYEAVFNKPITIKDKRGNSTTLGYDARGNLTSVVSPGGLTDAFTYDAAGRLISAKNANNSVITYQYNADGDLVKIQYPVGAVQYQYNGTCCSVSKVTDPNGNTLDMTYDLMNRVKTVKDAQGNTASYDYDAVGNLIKETNPNGTINEYGYDGLNRLASVKLPVGIWQYEYDGQSNLIKMTDANGHLTRYAYNKRNRLITETDPAGNSIGYDYDLNGNLTSRNDPNGNAVTYVYDALNRLIEKSYTGNTDKYGYDEAGNLISAYNNNIAYGFEYDNLNRLLKKYIVSWGKSLAYTYDAVGNRKTMTDHEGGVTSYTYDANNRLINLKNPANLTTTFDYDAGGRLKKQTNGNSTFTTYHYDTAGRVDSLTNWKNSSEKLSFFYYTFDKYGNRKSLSDKRGLNTYVYDLANRLNNVTYADGSTESFLIDGTGNRTQRTRNGIAIPYTYNAADQLQTAGTSSFVFDANGNTIQQTDNGQQLYKYDGQNRLLEVQINPRRKVQYKYDPFGEKIEKQDTLAVVTKLLYDGNNLLGELNTANVTQNEYTTALGMDSWLSIKTGSSNYFYHKDGLNSTSELTEPTSKTATQYSYDVYGNVLAQTGSVKNSVMYTGRLYESSSKLYDYRSRFYNAKVGKFLTKDGFRGFSDSPLSTNRYSYVENNPISSIDPLGFMTKTIGFNVTAGPLYGSIGMSIDNIGGVGLQASYTDVPAGEFGLSTGTSVGMFYTKTNADNIDNLEGGGVSGGATAGGKIPGLGGVYGEYGNITGNNGGKGQYYGETYGYGISGPSLKNFIPLQPSPYVFPTQTACLFNTCGKPEAQTSSNSNSTGSLSFPNFPSNPFEPYDPYGGSGFGPFGPDWEYNLNNPPGPNDPLPVPPPPDSLGIPIITPVDPNELIGPAGYDSLRWVSVKQSLLYKVLFENDPDFATAPAQNVTVYVPIHPKLNPSSLRLSDFGFGSFNFKVPPNTSIYSKRLDVRDSLGVFVDVTAGLDVTNQRAFWIFQSIDPNTGLAATLPANKGFLPVNDTIRHNGEGYVNFTIIPSALAQTRDTISATASIVFDTEETLNTNKWVNTIDAVAPTSKIGTLSAVVDSVFNVSWAGQDDLTGSGVKDYVLYVSKNNGPFTLYKDKLTITSEKLTGDPGTTFSFYTRAADNAGNVEADKTLGDRVVTVKVPGTSGIVCIGTSVVFSTTATTGVTYQWQVNTGAGFVNITDNDIYAGTTGTQLTIKQVLEAYYGYTYRCQIKAATATTYSPVQTLTFTSRWLGVAGESWHNPANWSCGIVPGTNTDVLIPANVPANPVLNTNAICRTLTMDKQSAITLKKDVELVLTGK